jgi:hypothetical protein
MRRKEMNDSAYYDTCATSTPLVDVNFSQHLKSYTGRCGKCFGWNEIPSSTYENYLAALGIDRRKKP